MSLQALKNITSVRSFLQDGDGYLRVVERAEEMGVPYSRAKEILDVVDAVLDEHIRARDIPELVKEAFTLSEEDARKLSCDVIGWQLLPFRGFLPGIEEDFLFLGGKKADYPNLLLEREYINAFELAKTLLSERGISFSDVLVKRLAFLVEQFSQGKKDEEGFRLFLGRTLPLGGMELEKETAEAIITRVRDMLTVATIVSDDEYKRHQELRLEELRLRQEKIRDTEDDITRESEELAQIPAIENEHREEKLLPPPKEVLSETPEEDDVLRAERAKRLHEATISAYREALDHILERSEEVLHELGIPTPAFADLSAKCLRGVRSLEQTRDVLERDYHVSGEKLVVLLEALRDGEDAYAVAVHALQKIGVDVEISQEQENDIIQEEAHVQDDRFAKHAIPAPAIVELTVGSVAHARHEHAPSRVTDIVQGRRLMGPIEQLETMTLQDFRRLAVQPDDAVKKMSGLLDALAKQSYEERIQGILSWKRSPLALLYAKLLQDALIAGVSLAEMLSRSREGVDEQMTPAEVRALGQWQTMLRF